MTRTSLELDYKKQRGGRALNHRDSGLVQRRANRRCAALSRSVQRLKGARLSAGLGLGANFLYMLVPKPLFNFAYICHGSQLL